MVESPIRTGMKSEHECEGGLRRLVEGDVEGRVGGLAGLRPRVLAEEGVSSHTGPEVGEDVGTDQGEADDLVLRV